MLNTGKIPPQNIQCENAVIGLCLIDSSNFTTVKALIKTHEIFYLDENQVLFKAMESLVDKYQPIDLITVSQELRECGKMEIAGGSYNIAKKITDVVSAAHIQAWCLILIECYIKRQSLTAVYNSAGIDDPLEAAHYLNETIKSALSFKTVNDWSDMSQIMLELAQRRQDIEQGKEFGVKTGFRELDAITGGLQTGFHVIGARPSVGKTAFASSVIMNIAKQNQAVGLISLEMPNVQMASRLLSICSGIEFFRIFRNKHTCSDESDFVNEKMADISGLPIFISDRTNVNALDIRIKAEKLVKNKNAKIIFIDYLQLVDTTSTNKQDNRQNEVQKLSRSLKLLSLELDIPIVALAQLNRESETPDKVGKVPKLSQLRESGAIEQDVDMGMILDRPFKRGQITNEHGESTEFDADLIIEKHRNGETRSIELRFNPATMYFEDKSNLSTGLTNIDNILSF